MYFYNSSTQHGNHCGIKIKDLPRMSLYLQQIREEQLVWVEQRSIQPCILPLVIVDNRCQRMSLKNCWPPLIILKDSSSILHVASQCFTKPVYCGDFYLFVYFTFNYPSTIFPLLIRLVNFEISITSM